MKIEEEIRRAWEELKKKKLKEKGEKIKEKEEKDKEKDSEEKVSEGMGGIKEKEQEEGENEKKERETEEGKEKEEEIEKKERVEREFRETFQPASLIANVPILPTKKLETIAETEVTNTLTEKKEEKREKALYTEIKYGERKIEEMYETERKERRFERPLEKPTRLEKPIPTKPLKVERDGMVEQEKLAKLEKIAESEVKEIPKQPPQIQMGPLYKNLYYKDKSIIKDLEDRKIKKYYEEGIE